MALIGAQQTLTLATLIDVDKTNEQNVANLYKKLLAKKNVRTYADFAGRQYADVRDMFDPGFYVDLVNEEYKTSLEKPITEADLSSRQPRIISRLEEYFAQHPMRNGAVFSHYRPARLFAERVGSFAPKLSEQALTRFEHAFKALNELLPAR